jgi:hypothetical protein
MPVPNPYSYSYEPKQAAEYSWTEEFQGRRVPIKVRVFYTPVELAVTGIKARGKYNALVFLGGNSALARKARENEAFPRALGGGNGYCPSGFVIRSGA